MFPPCAWATQWQILLRRPWIRVAHAMRARKRAKPMRAALRALVAALLLARALPALAQDAGLGGSFINPFPENDTYQVEVVGDWLADGLMGGLAEAFATGPGVVVNKKRYDLPALMLNRTDGDINALEQAFANDPSHIAIV